MVFSKSQWEEKKRKRNQQYKTIGKLKPRKGDQIWNFYQKAVEQCEGTIWQNKTSGKSRIEKNGKTKKHGREEKRLKCEYVQASGTQTTVHLILTAKHTWIEPDLLEEKGILVCESNDFFSFLKKNSQVKTECSLSIIYVCVLKSTWNSGFGAGRHHLISL